MLSFIVADLASPVKRPPVIREPSAGMAPGPFSDWTAATSDSAECSKARRLLVKWMKKE